MLVLVIFGCLRAGRGDKIAYAVGGYITAAYWFTSSTSFANPAVTGRASSLTPEVISSPAPADAAAATRFGTDPNLSKG